jgi:hypothetical protein
VAQSVRSLDLTAHTSQSPIRRGFTPGFVNYKKGCIRLATASDKVYQLLAHGRWFSPGTPASSTTKTGCHDIAEILLKVALSTKNQIKDKRFERTIIIKHLWEQEKPKGLNRTDKNRLRSLLV